MTILQLWDLCIALFWIGLAAYMFVIVLLALACWRVWRRCKRRALRSLT